MNPHLYLFSLLSLLQLFSHLRPVHCAQVPARLPSRSRIDTEPADPTSIVPISPNYFVDDKRVIASRLLRRAASQKQHSLRDVLKHIPQSKKASAAAAAAAKEESIRALHETEKLLFPLENDSSSFQIYRPPIALNVDSASSSEHHHQTYEDTSNTFRQTDTPSSSSEKLLLIESVDALETNSPSRATAALRTLEELCHSMHNGEALLQFGGFQPILKALTSRHRRVRASAAWAIATCCQNNRPVQKALLDAGAVPVLARLAWKDVLNVRARALFALNSLLGMEDARLAFEKLRFATQVISASLNDNRDFRATRRALNLVELLVRKNLDAWKTQLEAWDVTLVVERLLREHSDIDVRESAARIISALDGNTIA